MDSSRLYTRMRLSRSRVFLAVAAGLSMWSHAAAQAPVSETPAAPVVETSPTPSPAVVAANVSPTPSPAGAPRLLYPDTGSQAPAAPGGRRDEPGLSGLATSSFVLLGVCGAGWFLLRRGSRFALGGRSPRKLVVSESRSLGNRQFLVVVEYECERMLLGVTPGKIDYLCPLPLASAPSTIVFKEKLS